MKPLFYLLSLKISGIKNIEVPIELNFYKKTIKNDFNPEKYKIKAIYGENGSGKTAIITSVKILQNFLIDKNYLTDSNNQKTLVETINKKTQSGFIECEFYAHFSDKKKILKYKISFEIGADNRCHILNEKLEQKKGSYTKNVYNTVFETDNGILLKFGDSEMFCEAKEKSLNLLGMQTFATSIFTMKGLKEKYGKNTEFYYIPVLILFGLSLNVSIDEADDHKNYFLREEIKNIALSEAGEGEEKLFYHLMDWGHSGQIGANLILKNKFKEFQKKMSRMCAFVQIFKPELCDIVIEKKDYDKFYKYNLQMIYKDYSLDQEFESRGIKKIMELFEYLDMSADGQITFIDELDANINDVYLDKLIEYFILYGNGQLCFTAHNLSPMSLLKRNKESINFISSINTVRTWANNGNQTPACAYRNGFIEDSPFNVDASDFLGILGGDDE